MPCFSFTGGFGTFDCGSPLEDPERVLKVIPSRLQKLTGKRHIDYVVISHYHQDHLGNPRKGWTQNQTFRPLLTAGRCQYYSRYTD